MEILPFKLILPDLDVEQILELCNTNSQIAKICSDPQTWRTLLSRDYHLDINRPLTVYIDRVLIDIKDKYQELMLLNRELYAFIHQTLDQQNYYRFTDFDGINLQTVTNEFLKFNEMIYPNETTFFNGIKIWQHLFAEIELVQHQYQNNQIEIFGVLMSLNQFQSTKCETQLLNITSTKSLSGLLYYRSYLNFKLCLSADILQQIVFEHSQEPF